MRAVPRRLILLTVFALAASACAPDVASFAPPKTGPSGPRFVAEAVDIRENAGVGLGLAVDNTGAPNISYLRLNEQEVIPPAPIPADPKYLPAVMVASLDATGVWTREIVAQEAVDTTPVAASPTPAPSAGASPTSAPTPSPTPTEAPPEPKFTALDDHDTTDVAVDGDGHRHVAWTNGKQVQYANDHDGFPSFPEDELTTVARGDVSGVSITVDGNGNPWIAFYDSNTVKVVTNSGSGWTEEVVATRSGSTLGERTDAAILNGTPIVAYGDGGSTVISARRGAAWSKVADLDGVSKGLSLSSNGKVAAAAAASADGEVRVLNSDAGTSKTVAEGGGKNVTTGVAVDPDGTIWVAWNDANGVRYAQGPDFEAQDMPAGIAGKDPHLAGSAQGPRAAWYQSDTSSLTAAIFTDKDIPLAVPSPVASIANGPPPAADCAPDGTTLTEVAPVGAAAGGFETTCLAAPAGTAFAIEFDNQDAGVPHNIGIYTEAGGDEVFGGEVFPGPAQVTYSVDPLDAGTFHFQCDVHPATMFGTFVVAGAGGGSPTPEASGSATPEASGSATPSPSASA
jgi:hypothetical protein